MVLEAFAEVVVVVEVKEERKRKSGVSSKGSVSGSVVVGLGLSVRGFVL